MRTLYIECNMGAAGDMLMAALYELLDEKEAFIETMNSLGLAEIKAESAVKMGITGTHMRVSMDGVEERAEDARHEHAFKTPHEHEHGRKHKHKRKHEHKHSHEHEAGNVHEHSHTSMADIEHLIEHLELSGEVKKNIAAVYKSIADAEASAHGVPVSEIHFHEVGARDAMADIAGVCLLMEKLSPDQIVVSPVHVGSGFVHCAHGLIPVPAPATAFLLRDVPAYGGRIAGELCTPTGAALLKRFAASFRPMPVMRVSKIGYGMGAKDFEAPNCVRVFWGETDENAANGQVAELRCNLDDMTGEEIGHALRTLLGAGALDVFTAPVQMKKDRPGVLLTCVCDADKADDFAGLMLKHTSTFGVRKTVCERYTLDREIKTVPTSFGEIRVKTGKGYGVSKYKAEYHDAADAADRNAVTLREVENEVTKGMNTDGIE
ncbi:MAG: nickel pincer cofactor biosynthesis protein LarC [Clostridiales bacterium]|nr:nickel pincer cofactor biosynthesis protein LarC [Clostridiales bacterium]